MTELHTARQAWRGPLYELRGRLRRVEGRKFLSIFLGFWRV